MDVQVLETDYLVIGSGAMGMAFVDTLLAETDANIIMVDLHAKPGGHWNNAYPFVTLHQPSKFYGVGSKELSKGRIDSLGLNAGLNELSAEVFAELCPSRVKADKSGTKDREHHVRIRGFDLVHECHDATNHGGGHQQGGHQLSACHAR